MATLKTQKSKLHPLVSAYFKMLGRKGGLTKGKAKQRTPSLMSKASKIRWRLWAKRSGKRA